MVRFIIFCYFGVLQVQVVFTFQYGQIYYAVGNLKNTENREFTFQYGQIYYSINDIEFTQATTIYIPIWLDLL